MSSLDFAGGGPVHISSGWSALAYALVPGKRNHRGEASHGKAHNMNLVFLGTVLIWFGWFGFNGGSALNVMIRAMMAAFNTNTAASTGVLGWIMLDYVKIRKFSVVGACEGAIAGLIGITPAAGSDTPAVMNRNHILKLLLTYKTLGYVSVWVTAPYLWPLKEGNTIR